MAKRPFGDELGTQGATSWGGLAYGRGLAGVPSGLQVLAAPALHDLRALLQCQKGAASAGLALELTWKPRCLAARGLPLPSPLSWIRRAGKHVPVLGAHP